MTGVGKRWLTLLWVAVLGSALAVVLTSHHCRQLYAELTALQREANNLQVTWGQYLLEQGSLSSLTRVEARARELGMYAPEINEVIMVEP